MRTLTTLLAASLLLPTATARAGAPIDWTPPTFPPRTAPAPPPAEPAPPRPAKACGRRCQRRPRPDPRLAASAELRAQILRTAGPRAAAGRRDDATRLLSTAAAARADPVLYLAAAELRLDDRRAADRGLLEAISFTREAERLVRAPAEPRVAAAEGPALIDQSQLLAGYAARRREALRLQRRARGEVAAAGVFVALGLAGVATLASGAALISRVDRSESTYSGVNTPYLGELDKARNRAESMLAAGLVSALIGGAIGIPLTIVGLRDRRTVTASQEDRPRLRFTPGRAVSLTVRF
jgi:hypothetical protein